MQVGPRLLRRWIHSHNTSLLKVWGLKYHSLIRGKISLHYPTDPILWWIARFLCTRIRFGQGKGPRYIVPKSSSFDNQLDESSEIQRPQDPADRVLRLQDADQFWPRIPTSCGHYVWCLGVFASPLFLRPAKVWHIWGIREADGTNHELDRVDLG